MSAEEKIAQKVVHPFSFGLSATTQLLRNQLNDFEDNNQELYRLEQQRLLKMLHEAEAQAKTPKAPIVISVNIQSPAA